MSNKKNQPQSKSFSELRIQAEKLLQKKSTNLSEYSSVDMHRLIHELQIQQIEFELQNEALEQAHQELENSRNKYADLYDFAPVGYISIDQVGLIIEANLTGATLLGMEREALIGQSLSYFVAEEDRDKYELSRQSLFVTQTPQVCEIRLVRKDGSRYYASLKGIAVLDNEGQVSQSRFVVSDITERKQAERALWESESRLQHVFSSISDHIYMTELTKDGERINHYLSPVEALTGYSSEILKDNWDFWSSRIIHPEDRAIAGDQMNKLAQGQNSEVEYRLVRADGRIIWVRDSGRVERATASKNFMVYGVVSDITERKQAEEAYHMLVEHSLQGLAIFQDFHIVFANHALAHTTGYNTDELLSLTPDQLKLMLHPDDRAYVWKYLLDHLMGRPLAARFEFRFIGKDDKTRWVEAHASRIKYRTKPAVQVAFIDITERKQAEEALRESEARLDAVLSTATDAIITIDAEQRIFFFNIAAAWIFQYKPEEVIGQPISLLIPKRFRAAHEGHIVRFGQSGVTARAMASPRELKGRRADGEEFPIEAMISQVEVSGHKFFTVILRDVTERRRAEEERVRLFEAISQQREQLRALTGRLTEIQESERKQLARELHDQVGQNLTALGLNLNIIRAQIPNDVPGATLLYDRIDDSLMLTEQTTERIRDVMANLRPPVLDDYGLLAALRWYGKRFASWGGFTVAVQGNELKPRAASFVENTLFRIAQEALTNVAKHAHASRVKISIDTDDEIIRMIIADNGVGFDTSSLAHPIDQHSWGLLSMIERAETIGGHCHIDSISEKGTEIVVEVPR